MKARSGSARPEGADGRPTWADVGRARDAALAATRPRWHGSVERVYAAVKALAEAGTGTAITAEAVGEWCVDRHGGPGAPSIRNNPRLVAIVQIAASTRRFAAGRLGDRPVELALLEALDDPQMRSDLMGILAHRRQLMVSEHNMRIAVGRLEAISVLSREMAEAGVNTLEELAGAVRERHASRGGPGFDDWEIAACRRFLEGGMSGAGLVLDERSGEIIDRVQRTVAERGVASALAKVVASVTMRDVDTAARLRTPRTDGHPNGH